MAHGDGDLWSVTETMAYLDLGRTKVYGLLASGDLVRVHVGRRAWVLAASVRAYLDRQVSAATPAHGLPLGPHTAQARWPDPTALVWDAVAGGWAVPQDPRDLEGPG